MSVSGSRTPVVASSGAAPSEIVVATTNAVNISSSFPAVIVSGTYTKVTTPLTRVAGSLISNKLLLATGLVYLKDAGFSDADFPSLAYGYILIPPNATFQTTLDNTLDAVAFWTAGRVYDYDNEGTTGWEYRPLRPENASTDATIIPTSGWNYGITITAA
jgi:hypothetical protein